MSQTSSKPFGPIRCTRSCAISRIAWASCRAGSRRRQAITSSETLSGPMDLGSRGGDALIISLMAEPERFRGYYGAALAAEMSGDAKSARKYYGKLVQMAGKGEERPELTLAKAYLSQ